MQRSFVAAASTAAFLAFCGVPAAAFDTGPHASITIDSTMRAGFNRNAANVIQVENWLTDYYTSTPTIGSAAQCDLEKLHFDDVFNDTDVANYWKTFTANSYAAIRQAEKDGDAVEFYTALGMSLHVVQDFYSHSNWVERHAQGAYATSSWFDGASPGLVVTGQYANCMGFQPDKWHRHHGGYTSGMNHDSVVRPNYDRAYVFALAASYEWTQNVLSWVSPAFAAKVKSYAPNQHNLADLAYDQQASLYISEWIQTPPSTSLDGHWNGNHSGFAFAFGKFSGVWINAHDSLYVYTFKTKKLYATLSRNLYTGPVGQPPAITPYPMTGRIFIMRTLSVCATSAAGTESYFGTLAASDAGNAGYQYRDASQYHRPCTGVPWMQLVFVPSTQQSLHLTYSLWNEWNTKNNDMVPINGTQRTLSFTCLTAPNAASCTGDIVGGPYGLNNPYTTTGSGTSAAKVQMFFQSVNAAP